MVSIVQYKLNFPWQNYEVRIGDCHVRALRPTSVKRRQINTVALFKAPVTFWSSGGTMHPSVKRLSQKNGI